MFQSTSAAALQDLEDDKGKGSEAQQCSFKICVASAGCLGEGFHDEHVIEGFFLWKDPEYHQLWGAQKNWLKHLQHHQSIGYMEHSTAKQLKVSRKTAKRLRHVVKRIRLSLLNGQCCFCHPDALGAKQIDPWLWSDLHKLSKHNDASLFALIDCCDNDGNHGQLLDPFAEAILD